MIIPQTFYIHILDLAIYFHKSIDIRSRNDLIAHFKWYYEMFNLQLRPEPHRHVNQGHLALSGLQVRGHAMFSHRGLPLGTETLEYGWLVEVIVGDLTGRLTSSHVCIICEKWGGGGRVC